MNNTMYCADLSRRPSKNGSTPAKLEFPEALRLSGSVGRIWHAVVSGLRALDKRMTENLDYHARHMLYGDDTPGEDKRHKQ